MKNHASNSAAGRLIGVLVLCLIIGVELAFAGPFDDVGIPSDHHAIRRWAHSLVDYAPAAGADSNSNATQSLGPADGMTVSLGDISQDALLRGMPSGTITVEFEQPFRNGPGWDLAVFENAFAFGNDGYVFGELAYVEVSTDGDSFARFPATSMTQSRLDVGFGTAFSGIHPTDVHNLAGKHASGTGTSFDLSNLRNEAEVVAGDVNLGSIRYVRMIDIAGSPSYDEPLLDAGGEIAFPDRLGNPILDPWNTVATGTAGFDLDAVGARYATRLPETFVATPILSRSMVPEPGSHSMSLLGIMVLIIKLRRPSQN